LLLRHPVNVGEYLLRTDLEEIISSVPEEKAIALIFTNGLG